MNTKPIGAPLFNKYEASLAITGFGKAASLPAPGIASPQSKAVDVNISPEAKVLFEQYSKGQKE